MITEKDRIIEWLNRAAEHVAQLRKKPRLKKQKKLELLRSNYNTINIITKVVSGKGFMLGIPPVLPKIED